jgi:peptide/nickel transport system substrate-binding protein
VRRAIGYAFPYADIAAGTGAQLTARFVRTLMPPGVPGHIDYNPLSTGLGETDPDMARALLAEAGYEPGEFTLRFAHTSDPVGAIYRRIFTAAFEAAGFSVVSYPVSGSVFNALQSDPNAPYNLRPGGWCTDWPTGSAWMQRKYSTDNPEWNRSYLHEKAVDDEIERIRQLPLTEQPAAWGALDRLIETKYYPFVGTYELANIVLHGSRIAGINGDQTQGLPTWKDIYVTRR